MPTKQVTRQITSRDIEILSSLDRCPLTVEQMLKLSQTFDAGPFTSPRSVQDRLQKLCQAGWLRRWRYATTARGASPHYYKLTILGYRILHGENALPIAKRQFSEVGLAHEHHTRSLADFLVHTTLAAHGRGCPLKNFYRENTLRLTVSQDTLYPDCAFELITPRRRQYNFLVELDSGTERVRSDKDAESWERKIRLYDDLQSRSYPKRFRVLIVTTRSSERLRHILDAAGELVRNRQRSLFYGVYLDHYLREANAVCEACFLDHRGRRVSLLPARDFAVKCPHSVRRTIQPTRTIC
jgi:hypothetical protein